MHCSTETESGSHEETRVERFSSRNWRNKSSWDSKHKYGNYYKRCGRVSSFSIHCKDAGYSLLVLILETSCKYYKSTLFRSVFLCSTMSNITNVHL